MPSHIRFRSTSNTPGTAGKLGTSIFFLIFLAFGLFFCVMLLKEVVDYFQVKSWPAVSCSIESSLVSRASGQYVPVITYSYSIGGQTYTATRFRSKYKGSDNYSEAQSIVDRYPAGASRTCYVNPANAGDAVLDVRFPTVVIGIFIPLIFVLVGAGGVYFTWRREPEKTSLTAQPESLTQDRLKGNRAAFGICLLFFVIGLAMLYFLTIRPAMRLLNARSWPQVPCNIISAEVKSHQGDDSTTYSVDILYEYTVNGTKHRSNRYDFWGGSSSGRKGKQEVVSRYLADRRPVCYVNPQDPNDAVLVRDVTTHAWLSLLPIAFIAMGGGGMYLVRRQSRKSLQPISSISPISPVSRTGYGPSIIENIDKHAPVTLKSEQSTWKTVLFLAFFSLFWNGIISIFVVDAVKSWRTSSPDWFASLFMIPFVLVGIGMIIFTFFTFLKIFNPQITATLSRKYLALGDSASIDWIFTGRYDRIQRLTITLEAREEVTYRRGTDTSTDKHVFFSRELFSTLKQVEIARSSTQFAIPADSMHSFSASNNHIIWSLQVHAEIANWPDVKEEFRLNVQPAKAVHP